MSDLGLKPHGKRVLVQPIVPPAKKGSILLPEQFREQRPGEAVVVAIGPRVPAELALRVGDRVYTDRFQGQEVTVSGTMYRLHAPGEILAVIESV